MKTFLIQFKADYWCQGYEEATFTYLVHAQNFENACEKIKHFETDDFEADTARSFKNLTIE